VVDKGVLVPQGQQISPTRVKFGMQDSTRFHRHICRVKDGTPNCKFLNINDPKGRIPFACLRDFQDLSQGLIMELNISGVGNSTSDHTCTITPWKIIGL